MDTKVALTVMKCVGGILTGAAGIGMGALGLKNVFAQMHSNDEVDLENPSDEESDDKEDK